MEFKIPFYAKASIIFVGMFAFVSMLYITQGIVVPIIYSTVIAIVLNPLVNFFVKRKMNKTIAITLTLLLVSCLTIAIIALLSSQASLFSEAVPKLSAKFQIFLTQAVAWISDTFHVSPGRINLWISETETKIVNGSSSIIGSTLLYTGNVLIILVLIPVYIFMIIYYQPLLIEFIHKLFLVNTHKEVNEVLSAIKRIIQSYLVGLLLESAIIAILYTISLLILGIDYALLLGVVGAIFNIIPYVGGIVGALLPLVIALATKSSFSYVLLILAIYILIQFVDNHYIKPKIVGSKVKLNALVSVIVVIAGEALWGVSGMFLSIPLTAIVKVIFDHIEPLKPWGYLLGDSMPARTTLKMPFKKENKIE